MKIVKHSLQVSNVFKIKHQQRLFFSSSEPHYSHGHVLSCSESKWNDTVFGMRLNKVTQRAAKEHNRLLLIFILIHRQSKNIEFG